MPYPENRSEPLEIRLEQASERITTRVHDAHDHPGSISYTLKDHPDPHICDPLRIGQTVLETMECDLAGEHDAGNL